MGIIVKIVATATVVLLLASPLAAPAPADAARTIVLPPAAGIADYQLGGAYKPAADVTIVIRDRTDRPLRGVYSICYVNAFQTQPGSLRWWKKKHPSMLLRDKKKRLVSDPGWPGEVLLDLRTKKKRTAAAKVVGRWFDRCAADGYRATEPDNLDSWTRSRRLLTERHAIGYARLLVKRAHRAGLAIAQKNTPELSTRRPGFDFAVAEECEVYRECGAYTRTYGARVIEIEYTDNPYSAYQRACAARSGQISILLRDRDVVRPSSKGYYFRHC